ncbi:MAG: NADH-quinone oxidoreductase subunit M [Akkermansiaceae bacterium]|nr:NADH-quinone oxidoreductase subunit M [Akkermansiaceae bacterium]
MIVLLILIPIAAAIAIMAGAPARPAALGAALLNLVLGAIFALTFTGNPDDGGLTIQILEKPNIHLALGLYDGMSIILMLLTVIVTFAAVLSGRCPEGTERIWFPSTLFIAAGALGAFLSTDLFFFYAFHELALIPTFIMIGMLGRGDRKEAAWKITIYLAFGSIVLLAGLLWLVNAAGADSLLFDDLLASTIPADQQKGIAAFLLVGFGILVSLFPFHSWAAPAYASAPAPVSMLHAGVLKKFGLYGLLRLYPMISEGLQPWLTWLIVLLLGNILWVGFVTINQKRLDLMLGNSSVMHMGYVFLAIAALIAAGSESANPIAKPAAIVLMFAHGVSIALLFGLSDRIERKTGTLELRDLGGLAKSAPSLAFLFGLAGLASIGLPGLANFAGEMLVFLSGFKEFADDPAGGLGPIQVATILSLWGVVISAVYILRAYRRTFQGPVVTATDGARDLTFAERIPAVFLAFFLILPGLYPNTLIQFMAHDAPSAEPPQIVHDADRPPLGIPRWSPGEGSMLTEH